MNWRALFRPSPSDSARALAHHRVVSERERVRLMAQRIREELHLPPDPRLAR